MHIFRLFGLSVLVPLISVGLCSTSAGGKIRKEKNVFFREVTPRLPKNLSQVNATLSPVHFPSTKTGTRNATGPDSISPRSSDSLPTHPHPLHLDVHLLSKRVGNATSTEHYFAPRHLEEGRGWTNESINLAWIFKLLGKAMTSYAIVAVINLFLGPTLKKFGFGGPTWETSIKLGSSKDEKEDDHKGWGQETFGHQQPGHPGFNPHHAGPGWLSYDQAALALPYVDKYSMKAQKKAQHYTKKAMKYAQKASHYAAKAQAAKLAIKPLYANQFIHPGAATVPGVPSYGWGKR